MPHFLLLHHQALLDRLELVEVRLRLFSIFLVLNLEIFLSGAGLRVGSQSSASSTSGASSNVGSANIQTLESGYLDYSTGGSQVSGGKIIRPKIVHGEPIVSKAFFLHETVAEEPTNLEVEEREHVVRPRKHYNIVFVKAPGAGGSSISGGSVNVFPENEQKTIVYVLTGRNDGVTVNENGEIQLPEPKAPTKPEVVFVKYNSEDDATRAISDIQSKIII